MQAAVMGQSPRRPPCRPVPAPSSDPGPEQGWGGAVLADHQNLSAFVPQHSFLAYSNSPKNGDENPWAEDCEQTHVSLGTPDVLLMTVPMPWPALRP